MKFKCKTTYRCMAATFVLAAFAFLIPQAAEAKKPAKSAKAKTEQKKPNTFASPDFAFPETVINNAETVLSSTASDTDVVKALVQITIASEIRSNASTSRLISQIDSVATARGGATAAILYSLEAALVSQIYDVTWNADSRTLPLDQPFPEDMSQWSGDMFRLHVLGLCHKSLADESLLKSTPIKDWAPVLESLSDDQQRLCPDLYSFIAINCQNYLSDISTGTSMPIPFFKSDTKYLTPAQKCVAYKSRINNDVISHAYDIKAPALLAYELIRKRYDSWAQAFDEAISAYNKFKYLEDSSKLLLAADDFLNRFKKELEQSNGQTDLCRLHDQLKQMIKEYIATHPHAKQSVGLQNLLVYYDAERISLNGKATYRSNTPVKMSVSGVKADKPTFLKLFRMKGKAPKEMNILQRVMIHAYSEPVQTIELKSNSDECRRDTTEITFNGLPYGEYAVVLAHSGGVDRNGIYQWNWLTFKVSDITAITISSATKDKDNPEIGLYAVDNANGAPISNADVTYSYYLGSTWGKRDGIDRNKTDSQGYSKFTPNKHNGDILYEIKNGKDCYSNNFYPYIGAPQDNADIKANIYTDLALYHPGDTVRFAVVSYIVDGNTSKIAPAININMSLNNPSGIQLDSLTVTTDSFGRAEGSFKIPQGGMNGIFGIIAYTDNNSKYLSSQIIEVADYVLPRFFVEAKPTAKSYKPGDTVKIEGQAQTYSGMPVSGAEVKLTIDFLQIWLWRYRGGNQSDRFSTNLTTNAEGKFSLELPTENLPDRFTRGIFTVTASVTAPSGETRESASTRFSLGATSQLSISKRETIKLGKDSVRLSATVFDIDGTSIPTRLIYKLENVSDDSVVSSGEFNSPELKIESSQIPSGTYKWTVAIPDTDIKQTQTITFYRTSDTKPAKQTSLWIPDENIVADEKQKEVEVTLGSSYTDSHILCIVSDKNGIIWKRWFKVNAENIKIKLPVPEDNNRIFANISTVRDGIYSSSRIDVKTKKQTEYLYGETVTFRDKITAGGRESWKFRYKLGENKVGIIPVMATMTDKALNSIQPFIWYRFPEYYNYYQNPTYLSGNSFTFSKGQWYIKGKTSDKIHYVDFPQLNYYGKELFGYDSYPVLYEASYEDSNTLHDVVVVRGIGTIPQAAPTGSNTRSLSVKSAKKEYASNQELAEEEVATDGSAAEGGSRQQTENYRPSECPVAFFKPSLTTDSDGMLDLTFDAPDFNTTWQLQLLAYTPELKSVVQTLECTASKKVMVQAQLPQFLRTGDKTALRFTAFNNSGAKADITLTASVFNPYTGATICEKSFAPESTADKANFVKGLEFTAPSDLDMVGVKVMARIGESSDGEQSLIGILPSSTPVTESTPFYLAPDRMEYSMEIPHTAEAQTWLSYCDNPVWTCVTSLPDMTFPKDASILSLIRRFYGNSIAAGLSAKYPQIPQAIKLWKEENDSTLVSPLQRDNELKITDLDDTPWTLDAQAETQRMQRLATLLDAQKCAERTKDALDELLRRQNNQGGWSWCDGMRPSAYITGRVLLYFSMLRQMDFITLDKKADNAIRKAVAYTDSELYKDYIRSKKHFSTSQMLNYLYVRSGLGDINMSSDFASLKNLAINAIRKEWRGFGIYDAAVASILLKREGYPMEARGILESLRQKALSSQERGMWYDNLSSSWDGRNKLITTMQVLEAYSEVTPQAPAVDLLRQWLLIQRQTENWGTADEIAEVVYAILSSESDWTQDFAPATFKLDGKLLQTSRRDALTGSFTMPLTQGGTLTISKSAGHQAWGGVLSRRIAPITDVKAYSASDISVSKRILIMKEDANGTTATELKEGDALHVGDKVRVELLLVSQRDMDYVTVIDGRSACLSPIEQLSGYVWQDGGGYYRDVRTDRTNLFFDFLKKGSTYATYDCYVTQEGRYTLGIAQTQCLYAPMQTAHSAGAIVPVDAK